MRNECGRILFFGFFGVCEMCYLVGTLIRAFTKRNGTERQ